MNLTVHALMYFFYTLTALGYRPTAYAQFITIIQILQMLVGTAVTAYVNFHMHFVEKKAFTLSMEVPPELSTAALSCQDVPRFAFQRCIRDAHVLFVFVAFLRFLLSCILGPEAQEERGLIFYHVAYYKILSAIIISMCKRECNKISSTHNKENEDILYL